MIQSKIIIRGAREHFLKNLNIELPRNQFIVMTGVSGSGKSSLAVDTIYQEGRRRYLELSLGENKILFGNFPRPQVDSIEGLPPVFYIGGISRKVSPRSTVGSLTEIYDYARLLYSWAGTMSCYKCGQELQRFTPHQIIEEILKLPQGETLWILSPMDPHVTLSALRKEGFVRVRHCGALMDLENIESLNPQKSEVVIDRVILGAEEKSRIADSVELALRFGKGAVKIYSPEKKTEWIFSADYRCLECALLLGTTPPGFFSFNNPYGACPKCHGLGFVSDGKLCSKCKGSRFKPEVLAVRVGGLNMDELARLDLEKLLSFLKSLRFKEAWKQEALSGIFKKITARIHSMMDLGLSYLSIHRRADTLSSGELQRVKLAAQMASGLVGVVYILDEPTSGLHWKEIQSVVKVLRRICDEGNTVIVVEHDQEVIKAADFIVELGPGAGPEGGAVTIAGTQQDILSDKDCLTGQLLRGDLKPQLFQKLDRNDPKEYLRIKGARIHNLKNIDVNIPLGVFCCVTGVSGSGKSTLVIDVLSRAFQVYRNRGKNEILGKHVRGIDDFGKQRPFDFISGIKKIDRLILLDPALSSQSARSNVATLTDIFNEIRNLFSQVPESRLRGYTESRFSFNLKGGQCEICRGKGVEEVQMFYLPDLEIPCEVCQGLRYNHETLEVKYKGKNIAEVLDMTVTQAALFFNRIPRIAGRLMCLEEIGLGYLKLAQCSLSSGEDMRLKLATQLSRKKGGRNLYVLDEPTRGLHVVDIGKLLSILFRLRDQGNSILVIEHHQEVIQCSDYVIELGPGAGDKGGYVVSQGPRS